MYTYICIFYLASESVFEMKERKRYERVRTLFFLCVILFGRVQQKIGFFGAQRNLFVPGGVISLGLQKTI